MDPREDRGLVEREAELGVLAEALAGACDGRGTALLLEGEAGIGKTALLEAACAAARDLGLRFIRARGTPLDEGAAYGIARQLVLPALNTPDMRERLLQGAASLARPALLEENADGAPVPEAAFAVREGLSWLVVAMAEEAGPLALIVDDLHWADGASVRFLRALATRIDDLPVALLLAARPAPAWSDPGLAADVTSELRVMPLSRLSSQGVSTVIGRRLRADPTDEFAGAVHAQTAGTPYLVTVIADFLEREGMAPKGEALERLGPADVGRNVAARIRGLSPDARAIASAVAILGDGRPAAEAQQLAGVDHAAAAVAGSSLEAAGLVRGWPEPFFDHPLVSAAVLEDLSSAERIRLHDRAADLAMANGEAERAAAHLEEVPGRTSPRRFEVLHRVGARALRNGAADVAARHLRRALAEPPPDAALAVTLFELGLSELALGYESAPDRLVAAADAWEVPDLRLRALMICGHALTYLGHWDDAFERMKAAVAQCTGASQDALVLARLEQAAVMLTCISTGREASSLVDSLDSETPDAAAMRPLVEGLVALRDVTQALPRERVEQRAQLARSGPIPEQGGEWAQGVPAIALVLADSYSEAEAIFEELIPQGRKRRDVTAVRIYSAWLALGLLRRGGLAEAQQAALAIEEGEAPPAAIADLVGSIVRGSIALEQGDLARASHWVDRPIEHDPRISDTNMCDDLLVVRGRLRLAERATAEAYALFAAAGTSQAQWGGESPPITQWRTYMALAAAELGRHTEAMDLIEEEIAVAERFGAPRPLAAALRIYAAIGSDDASSAERALLRAIHVLEGSGAVLERAKVDADLGELMLREGRTEGSQEPLRRALEQAWACGADALAERARASLIRAGARPRRPELTGVRALTAAEARTARMAAGGMTNREVAEALFVSEKTVETHLTAAYRKLNVDGRFKLSAALGAASQGVDAEKTRVSRTGDRT